MESFTSATCASTTCTSAAAASMRASRGFSLVELMVGMVIGLLVSAAAVSAFLAHTRAVYQQVGYNQASEDVNEAFAVLYRLLLQAQRDSIVITNTESGGVPASTTIDLALPEGFPVWPNETAPWTNNWVRVAWNRTGGNAEQITIANAATEGGLAGAGATVLTGGSAGNNTRITRMTLVEDEGTAPSTYLFALSGKSYARDDVDGSNTDTGATVEGRILPRN